MILQIVGVLFAFVILYYGAEFTLNSSERLGRALGLSPLAIGVLVIGFGTSLPEFFVSQIAALEGKPDLALGNLLGSNIANSLLILGIAAMFASIPVRGKNIWGQIIFHGVLHISLFFMLVTPELSLLSKLILLALFVIYIIVSVRNDFKHVTEVIEKLPFKWKDFLVFLIGVVMLFAGGELLVSQGSALGLSLGVSEYFISVIFISFGTSFPELVTSVIACVKKKDISLVIGNVLGSNFFNMSLVLGSLLHSPVVIKNDHPVEIKVLILISLLFAFFALIKRIPRIASVFLLSGYVGMVYYWSQFSI